MNAESKDLIARYISGDLDVVERRDFERRLESDSQFEATFNQIYDERTEALGLLALTAASPELSECLSPGTLQRYFDDELQPEERQLVQAHLPCPLCRSQLDALKHPEGPMAEGDEAPPDGASVLPFLRRAKPLIWTVGLAAAGLLAFLLLRPTPPPQIEFGDSRPYEGRLSHSGVAHFRNYDTVLSGRAPTSHGLPLAVLARLKEQGDLHALAAVYLEYGEPELAQSALHDAPVNADVCSDRSAISLELGNVEEALESANQALALDEDHGAAKWNRALALQRLGLPLLAAKAFEGAQRLHPDWALEARGRGKRLREETLQRRAAWRDLRDAGRLMARGGTLLTEEQLALSPDTARLYIYDALRTADSASRWSDLAQLARRLGVPIAEQWPSDRNRMRWASAYKDLLNRQLSRKDATDLLQGSLRDGQSDIYLGTALQLGVGANSSGQYRAVAEDTQDTWFLSLADGIDAAALLQEGKEAKAIVRYRTAIEAAREPYRRDALRHKLAELLLSSGRMAAGRSVAAEAFAELSGSSDWPRENVFVQLMGRAALTRAKYSVAHAFFEEALLREPELCTVQRNARSHLGLVGITEKHPAVAKQWMDGLGKCDVKLSPMAMGVLVDVTRQLDPGRAAQQELLERLESLEARSVGDHRAVATYLKGRHLIELDPPARRDILLAVSHNLEGDQHTSAASLELRSDALDTLAIDAVSHNQGAEALAFLARRSGVSAPTACVVGVALDDERRLIISRDDSGSLKHALDRSWQVPLHRMDPSKVIPKETWADLRACDEIAILAAPPLLGRPELVPPNLAWSFLLGSRLKPQNVPARRLVVSVSEPSPSFGLPSLPSYEPAEPMDVPTMHLRNAAATKANIIWELSRGVTELEIYSHGQSGNEDYDGAALVLGGRSSGAAATLSARDLEPTVLKGRPLVALGACAGGTVSHHAMDPWSLPQAFIGAGARAVIASRDELPAAGWASFYAEVRAALGNHQTIATAVRDARTKRLGQGGDTWPLRVITFRSANAERTSKP